MKRILSFLLCFLALLSAIPVRADDTQQITVPCYVSGRDASIDCTLVVQNNQVYINARTAALLSGWTLDHSSAGSASFSLGSQDATYIGGNNISVFGETWFPIEALMDELHTHATVSAGALLISPSSAAVQELNDILDNYEQMTVAVDPDEPITSFGLSLAKLYNIASNFQISDLIGHQYEEALYRSALYALLMRSDDKYETTLGSLCGELESDIVSPLSEFFDSMGKTFSSDVLEAFYAGSDLEYMKELVDAYKSVSKGLSMSPAELYTLMEETAFYNGIFDAGAVGLEYVLKCAPGNEQEERLLKVIQQIVGIYRQNTKDMLKGVVADIAGQIVSNHLNDAAKTALLGPFGQLFLSGVNSVMQTLPGVSAMDELETCAVFYQIQELAAQKIREAQASGDYVCLKYAAIIYYRCVYLSAVELVHMDSDMITPAAKDAMTLAEEKEKRLLSLSDSRLSLGLLSNQPVSAEALLGPAREYVDFYQTLVEQYGELDVRDYSGTEYIEEGSGIILPWLATIDDTNLMVVLRQENDQLIQSVYLDVSGEADFVHIEDRTVLVCGRNRTFYYGFSENSGSLLSCTAVDTSLSAFSFHPDDDTIETSLYTGDPASDSISSMLTDAFNQMYSEFGDCDYSFCIDGSNGLFQISPSPADLRARFIESLN